MLSIKDFKEEELYKKCGFKKAEDFVKQIEWTAKYEEEKYYINNQKGIVILENKDKLIS